MNQNQPTAADLRQVLRQSGVTNPSADFVAAVTEGSTREHDWLLYADRMLNDDERRYCWQRALEINRDCHTARVELDFLKRKQRLQAQQSTTHSPHSFGTWKRLAVKMVAAVR